MIKDKIIYLHDWLDDHFYSLVGRLSPDGRIKLVLFILLFSMGLSLYFTISALHRFGKSIEERECIDHIENPFFSPEKEEVNSDSLNEFNP